MTPRQRAALAALHSLRRDGIASATVREVQHRAGLSSSSVAAYSLRALAAAGHVRQDARGHWQVRIDDEALLERLALYAPAEVVEQVRERLWG